MTATPQPAAAPAAPAPAASAAPGPAPPAPRPGWTTTEFWSTTLVHVLGVVATVLVVSGRGDEGIGAAEAAVPIVALIVSGVLTLGYTRARSRAKLEHLHAFAAGIAGDLERISPLLTRDAHALEPLAEAVDPAAVARLRAASEAWKTASP